MQEWEYGDRCQEIVFIGKELNHEMIQTLLDSCLLHEAEMEMGPRMWQSSWYDSVDKIRNRPISTIIRIVRNKMNSLTYKPVQLSI